MMRMWRVDHSKNIEEHEVLRRTASTVWSRQLPKPERRTGPYHNWFDDYRSAYNHAKAELERSIDDAERSLTARKVRLSQFLSTHPKPEVTNANAV